MNDDSTLSTDRLLRIYSDARLELADTTRSLQLLEDLNTITPYITRYYSRVHRHVQRHTPSIGLQYKSWPHLFSAAMAEAVLFDEYEIDSQPISNAITTATLKLGGLTLHDWLFLQSVRQLRNKHGHPQRDDQQLKEIVASRWTMNDSLAKLSRYLLSSPDDERK